MSLIDIETDSVIFYKIREYYKDNDSTRTKSFDFKNRRIEIIIDNKFTNPTLNNNLALDSIYVSLRYIGSEHIHPCEFPDRIYAHKSLINIIRKSDMYIDHITNKRDNNLSKILD